MFDSLFGIAAPHHCYGCQKIGTLLCDNCKYDITSEPFLRCLACGQNSTNTGVCTECRVAYQRAWCVGERSDVLQYLIGGYKFQYARDAYRPMADLLDDRLPELPPGTVIVPIPTVASHIRERGFDHMKLIASRFAKIRNVETISLLSRATNTKQRDANRGRRINQAKTAFRVSKKVDPDIPYLLLDDVVTTGATLHYAAKTLQDAGAETIWTAAIARQPLD